MPASINNTIELVIDITSDASSGQSYTVPRAGTVVGVSVICTAANGGGTVTVRNGTDAITDAIACAVLDTVTAQATLDQDFTDIAEGGTISVITNGAADRGKVIVQYAVAGQALTAV